MLSVYYSQQLLNALNNSYFYFLLPGNRTHSRRFVVDILRFAHNRLRVSSRLDSRWRCRELHDRANLHDTKQQQQ
jgi:hypothetical protein